MFATQFAEATGWQTDNAYGTLLETFIKQTGKNTMAPAKLKSEADYLSYQQKVKDFMGKGEHYNMDRDKPDFKNARSVMEKVLPDNTDFMDQKHMFGYTASGIARMLKQGLNEFGVEFIKKYFREDGQCYATCQDKGNDCIVCDDVLTLQMTEIDFFGEGHVAHNNAEESIPELDDDLKVATLLSQNFYNIFVAKLKEITPTLVPEEYSSMVYYSILGTEPLGAADLAKKYPNQ